MDLEEFRALTTRIAQNLDNQGLVTELLTQAVDGYEQTTIQVDTMNAQALETASQIDQLQKTNMNLFLKVGQPTNNQETLETTEPMTYEGLLSTFEGGNN